MSRGIHSSSGPSGRNRGSNTVHLLVADTGIGLPLPVHAIKTKLRLAERVDADGRPHANAVNRLAEAVAEAVAAAQK